MHIRQKQKKTTAAHRPMAAILHRLHPLGVISGHRAIAAIRGYDATRHLLNLHSARKGSLYSYARRLCNTASSKGPTMLSSFSSMSRRALIAARQQREHQWLVATVFPEGNRSLAFLSGVPEQDRASAQSTPAKDLGLWQPRR